MSSTIDTKDRVASISRNDLDKYIESIQSKMALAKTALELKFVDGQVTALKEVRKKLFGEVA